MTEKPRPLHCTLPLQLSLLTHFPFAPQMLDNFLDVLHNLSEIIDRLLMHAKNGRELQRHALVDAELKAIDRERTHDAVQQFAYSCELVMDAAVSVSHLIKGLDEIPMDAFQ